MQTDIEIDSYTSEIELNGLKIVAAEGKAITVDTSNKIVEERTYTQRIKMGGTGSTSSRCFVFTPDVDCSVTIDGSSASTSADRECVIEHGETDEPTPTIDAEPTPTSDASDETLVEASKSVEVGNGVVWSADDIQVAEYTSTFETNGLYIGAAEDAKVVIDTNNASIDGRTYKQRIKTGGTGDAQTGVRALYFKPDANCDLVIDATSSSSSGARTVEIQYGGMRT